MAGYFIYSLDTDAWTQLTTSPTKEQGLALADDLIDDGLDDLLDELEDDAARAKWPTDRDALADTIIKRLASPDWYADLNYGSANFWDSIVHSLTGETPEAIALDFQCYDYESIYWDCAEIAAKQGATMMAEPQFGSSAFRYSGKPPRVTNPYEDSDDAIDLMYSIYSPERSRELLNQLEAVEPHFASLTDDEEGSPREQFFEGLLPPVKDVVARNRTLWVQTDT